MQGRAQGVVAAQDVGIIEERARVWRHKAKSQVFVLFLLWGGSGRLLAFGGEDLMGGDGEDLGVLFVGCRSDRPGTDEYACQNECEREPQHTRQLGDQGAQS